MIFAGNLCCFFKNTLFLTYIEPILSRCFSFLYLKFATLSVYYVASLYGSSHPYWHQTIHQYRKNGVCSFKRCTIGFSEGIRTIKIFTLFREPKTKFVSGMYFFARWENRKKLFSQHPANLTLGEFDDIAKSALQIRMKAPVQEYTEIFGKTPEKNLKWKEIANKEIIEKAKINIKRDIDGIGILEDIDNFVILLSLELGWEPRELPCMGRVNKGHFSHNEDKTMMTYGYKDLRKDQQEFVSHLMVAEIEIYEYAIQLATEQEMKYGRSTFKSYLKQYQNKCEEADDDIRITTMRVDAMKTTKQKGKTCAIARLGGK